MLAAIGDIHGQYEKLDDVVRKLEAELDFEKDTLIFLGDYVDGGNNTEGVINYLMSLQAQHPHFQFLYGNHEDMMLDALIGNSQRYVTFYQWWNQGGKETAQSYGCLTERVAQVRLPQHEHLRWIRRLPYTYETDKFIFVHAGLGPSNNVDDTPNFDKIWMRGDFYDAGFPFEKKVIYGHSVDRSLKPRIRPYSIGIDTMHHGYGVITAVILDDSTGDVVKFITSFE